MASWGWNDYGQLGDGTKTTRTAPVQVSGLTGVAAIEGGRHFGLAAKTDGTVWGWGYNNAGQLGTGTTTKPNAGQLTPAQSKFSGGVVQGSRTSSTYGYNGDGLRTSQTSGGTTSGFVWAVAEAVPPLLSDGTKSFIYGPNGPIKQIDGNGAATYLHPDQLGSTRLVTDAAGAVVGTYTFDAYGKQTAKTGTATTPLGFAGQYTDAETGFQYLRARYYDPATAQFVTRDPIEQLTREPYGYVNGNPLNAKDPLGLWPHIAIAGAIGAVVGGVAGGIQHVTKNGFSDPRGFAASVVGGAVGGAVVGSCTVGTGHVTACGGAGSVAGGWLTATLAGDDYTFGDAAFDAAAGAVLNKGIDMFSPWPINRGWFRPTRINNIWSPGKYATRIYKNEALNSAGSLGFGLLRDSLTSGRC